MKHLPWLVVLAGCHAVLGLDELEGDGDRDGVPDGDDRCPAFDDRIDEDADGVPDACDNCPETANADQANADQTTGDDAGDACDPDAAANTCFVHRRVAFDAFNRESLDDWAVGTGTWTVESGALRQSNREGRHFAHLPLVRLPSVVARLRAEILALQPQDTSTSDTGLMLVTFAAPGGTSQGSGYQCWANAKGSDHTLLLRRRLNTGQEDTFDTKRVSGLFQSGGIVSLVAVTSRGTQVCDVAQINPAAAAQDPAKATNGELEDGEVMVVTEDASVAFLAIDLLTVTGPCP